MNKDDFQIIQMKTCELKVNIHCHGCQQKVKKILRKIQGVYSVDLDAEKQKVKVSGNVDSRILIKKLVKSGKYAELWPSDQHYNHNQEISSFINAGMPNDPNHNTSLNAPKSQPLLTPGYPRGLEVEDQLSFERYLKQNMDMDTHAQMGMGIGMGRDDSNGTGSLIGNNNSGFIELEGSQLGGFAGSFNDGLRTYHDHQSSLPMYQQSHLAPLIRNMNMQNMHQPQISNHPPPVFHRAHYY